MERPFPIPPAGKLDAAGVADAFAHRMMYSVAKDKHTATPYDAYEALAYAVRDRLMERWFQTQSDYYQRDAKRVYYLSLEFLIGRLLRNNIANLGARDAHARAMEEIGYRLEDLEAHEFDAGLGNGGLGRLAACILDSAATLAIPFYGYGIRYEYGIFRQRIRDGQQVESPDNWLRYPNPWEIARPDALFRVRFYGRAGHYHDEAGHERWRWDDAEEVLAMAYDTPIVGYGNGVVNTLRLWSAKATREFDLSRFNAGEYVDAVDEKAQTESISKVLYPADDRYAGKELRLKQQYFFVSATLQDILRRFKKRRSPWQSLADKVAIQLNDTHPSIAIPELMRMLLDEERLGWDDAWPIVQRVTGYTNHTVLPEALEAWSCDLIGRLLPRHLQIVEEIDARFCRELRARKADAARIQRAAIIDRAARQVRMAHLAIVGSHSVNGVAEIHSRILRDTLFRDFDEVFPGKFKNVTNGITPRRWLAQCNPRLAALITEAIGERWLVDLEELRALADHRNDAAFAERWRAVKRANKAELARWLQECHQIAMDPEPLLDCQIKRIHEYKRQLLNVLHALSLYHAIKAGEARAPRTILFGGKAAPGYFIAKLVIRLVHAVADMIERDPAMRGRLRVIFVPNYGVTAAEMIFPACELSEQISTAGTEASGTGNMKAALNGALTIGTLDGANIEIRDAVGADKLFIFGLTADEARRTHESGYQPESWIARDAELKRVVDTIRSYGETFRPIVDILTTHDRYLHCADWRSYLDCQKRAEAAYRDPARWTSMSIANVARMGRFSADRTVRDYATTIWRV
ncbi:MAG: glycogen phosphorylase [Betaproteobacteria bacterium RIFCSPLOWO2_12_FULL_65_14]|nr:MAG: glycogen phosphorylase [Betaproteobacteria bacterium RIFCSPLOWO2_12_FULL_65_14]